MAEKKQELKNHTAPVGKVAERDKERSKQFKPLRDIKPLKAQNNADGA